MQIYSKKKGGGGPWGPLSPQQVCRVLSKLLRSLMTVFFEVLL